MNIAVTYLIVEQKVLLLYKDVRAYHVAPGGKVEADETIVAAAKREFFEETGLLLSPKLAAISTIITSAGEEERATNYNLFTFYATDYTGDLLEHSLEGTNAWHTVDAIFDLPMFVGDKLLLQRLLEKISQTTETLAIDYAYFTYDATCQKLLASQITG